MPFEVVSVFVFVALAALSSCKPVSQGAGVASVVSVESIPLSKTVLAASQFPPWSSLPQEPKARANEYRKIVGEILAKTERPLSDAENCTGYSQIWIEELALKHGYKLHIGQTASESALQSVELLDGASHKASMTHEFVVDRSLCKGEGSCDAEIIIDPTYIQFLESGECVYRNVGEFCKNTGPLKSLPKVLVGTHSEILEFFAKHKARLRLNSLTDTDPMVGKYTTLPAVSLIYSFQNFSGMRVNVGPF
jgi:hypothetical protein